MLSGSSGVKREPVLPVRHHCAVAKGCVGGLQALNTPYAKLRAMPDAKPWGTLSSAGAFVQESNGGIRNTEDFRTHSWSCFKDGRLSSLWLNSRSP